MIKKLILLDLPQELINLIAIYSKNLEFCVEFAEHYTIKKVYNKKIHHSVYLLYKNNLTLIEILLKQKKLRNTQELLNRAMHVNNFPIAKLLLEQGVDVSENGKTLLMYSAANNRLNMVKILVEYGCDPAADQNKIIQIASEHGNIDIVRYLLELHKRYRISTAPRQHHAFRAAAERGYHEIVEIFLNPPKSYKKSVNINAQLGYAVRMAARNGHEKVVAVLIQYGADLTHYGNLALRLAAESNHLNICKLLIDAMFI